MKKYIIYAIAMAANVALVGQSAAMYSALKTKHEEEAKLPFKVEQEISLNPFEIVPYRPAFYYDPTIQLPLVASPRPTSRPASIHQKCLALNLYHEARGEEVQGQIRVGYVTLNRVKDRRWPDNICGVVYQPEQFSWTIYDMRVTNWDEYEELHELAGKIIRGEVHDNSKGSNHYYAHKTVNPWWATEYTLVGVMGGHTFLK